MNFDKIKARIADKRILILGFGKEGQASYRFIRKLYPDILLSIADKRIDLFENFDELKTDLNLNVISGENYLEKANEFEVIIKSPGISLLKCEQKIDAKKITSQTDLFLTQFANQTIGITGTKGKSTTTSLIYHVLKAQSENVLLVGNIGLPPFDFIDIINEQTIIVFELSSHQLEYLTKAPHVSILLNIYQEHLDHYNSYKDYQLSKYNITLKQNDSDVFIYPANDKLINALLDEFPINRNKKTFALSIEVPVNGICISENFLLRSSENGECLLYNVNSPRKLRGKHNLLNIEAAYLACEDYVLSDFFFEKIAEFEGLPHRLQFVGEYNGILYYNDSIATIPEATIQAIETLKNVDSLILGGFDRGVDYSILADYLQINPVRIIFFIGIAGIRIFDCLKSKGVKNPNWKVVVGLDEAVALSKKQTLKGGICLLSPAASSYDSFKNFEHRGQCFIDLIKK